MKLKLLAAAMLLSTVGRAQSHVSTSGLKHVLIEEGTGAWCGYCPDGTYTLDTLMAAHSRVIAISIHDNINTIRGDQTSDDMMEVPSGYDYNHTAGLGGGYPSGSVDRVPDIVHHIAQNKAAWSYAAQIALNDTEKFDVTLDHDYNSATNTITIWVKATTLVTAAGEYNINAVVTEDSIACIGAGYEQHSNLFRDYTSHYYHKGTPNADTSLAILGPSDFAQRHVLKDYLGGIFGNAGIIANNPVAGTTFSKKYTFVIPASCNKKYLHIVGFVQKYNASDILDRRIENAIEARFDSTALPLGINETNDEPADFSLFPNPASNSIFITATNTSTGTAQIVITDAIGRQVVEQAVDAADIKASKRIDVSSLAAGVYLLKITNGNSSVMKKLVISR